jgi:hypothetical protein
VTSAVVNVMAAWMPLVGGAPEVAAISGRQRERQVAAIGAALMGLPASHRPVVTGQVVQADPVAALATAASVADLVVIDSRDRQTELAWR